MLPTSVLAGKGGVGAACFLFFFNGFVAPETLCPHTLRLRNLSLPPHSVFTATLNNRYALKTIKKVKVKRADYLRREIDLLLTVNHPNIINVVDVFEDKLHLQVGIHGRGRMGVWRRAGAWHGMACPARTHPV